MHIRLLFHLLLASVTHADFPTSETNNGITDNQTSNSIESSTSAIAEEEDINPSTSGHFLHDLLRSSSGLVHIRQELERLNQLVNGLKSTLDRMESNRKEDMLALQEDIQSLKTTSGELETDVQTSSEAMERMSEWTIGTDRKLEALERSCSGNRKRHETGSKSLKVLKKKRSKGGAARVSNEEFLLQPQADEGLTNQALPVNGKLEQGSVPVDAVKECSSDIKTEVQKMQKQCADMCKPLRPSSCADIQRFGTRKSGIYTINPWMSGYDSYTTVKCDLKTDGGGWTIIQHRDDYGSPKENFSRNWTDYKMGFGDIRGEFWLGNEIIYALTNQEPMILRVELESFDNETKFAEYSHFRLGSEERHYRLNLGSYSGTSGGWWFNNCHDANLNGFYYEGNHESYADGINWYHWKGFHYSLKRTEMKIRPQWMNDVIKDGG